MSKNDPDRPGMGTVGAALRRFFRPLGMFENAFEFLRNEPIPEDDSALAIEKMRAAANMLKGVAGSSTLSNEAQKEPLESAMRKMAERLRAPE